MYAENFIDCRLELQIFACVITAQGAWSYDGIRKTAGQDAESKEEEDLETVQYWPVTRDELLRQAAGKLAGFRMDHGANSPEDGEKMRVYMSYLEPLRRGDYSDMEIAGILAPVEMRDGLPVINNGTDAMTFNRYRTLLNTVPDERGLPLKIYDCGIFIAYSRGRATEEELCGYIDSLLKQMYICERDYDYLMAVLPTLKHATPEVREKTIAMIGELFDRRENVIEVYYPKRTRSEIMFYVQISLVMIDEGYDEAFVAGVVGNIMGEGACGKFENANYEKNPGDKPSYLTHVSNCIGYMEKYHGHNVTQVDLVQLFDDVVCTGEKCGYDIHGFGVGSVQWSFERTEGLLEFYLAECGYDVSGEEFQEQLEEYQKASEEGNFSGYEGIYIDIWQVRRAEAAYIIYEFGQVYPHCNVYPKYLKEVSGNPENDVQTAARIVMEEYIRPKDESTLSDRQTAAAEWYQMW